MNELDSAQIHFSTGSLWILNAALAIVMFGVALGISIDDFKRVLKDPKLIVLGVFSQFIILPFLIAKLFGLSFENQKTLAIETGIQNSGLGLLLIFTFFNGLGSMAIMAAFWGIWHIISGLLLALYWSKSTKKPVRC
tara:strand:- start:4752 stop:5162 length:411 start_codon:yes stop_codon:yes gene_type:complete